jgi:uncharacterized protein
MEYIIIILVAFAASMLTFFSGFGLGTILTPAFILFLPTELAVAATAIVHFLNNLFKLTLIGKHTMKGILIRFGIPAILGAFIGAAALGYLSQLTSDQVLFSIFGFNTTLLNFTIGLLIIVFSLFELIPSLKNLQLGHQWLVPGGIISGFFGGLSGHQGALRSAFLIKLNLSKEQFVATGIAIACLVDTMRIGTYAFTFDFTKIIDSSGLLVAATAAAFGGAILGKKLLKKVTIESLQTIIGIMMILIGVLLMFGVI